MKKTWKILLYCLASLLGVWLTAKYLLPIGLPFLLGYGIARLAEPVVRFLRAKAHFPRAFAAIVCILTFFALLGLLLWFLGKTLFTQADSLVDRLPALLEALKGPAGRLKAWLLGLTARLPDGAATAAGQWIERFFGGGSVLLETASGWLLNVATAVMGALPDLMLFLLTALLSAYLFSIELPRLSQWVRKLLPEEWLSRTRTLLGKLRHALGAYFKAELRLCLITCAVVTVGLLLLRVNSALLLGLGIALVDILPVFGIGTVLIPWGLVSLLLGNTAFGVKLLLLYLLASLTRSFLEPRVVGRQMGLHPLLTLVAIYAGFRLFGIFGMILLPIAIMVCKQIYDYMEAA
ncbi:MAG: sporulation integral membrane protein YtvI [Oscillospiraceae bacterium]|nr:sporulation integral membrane protein YtvI [Oscillospiraceae bacterium]